MNDMNRREVSAEVTFHGLYRTMERTGKDASHSIKLVRKAWNRGKPTNEYNLLWNILVKEKGVTIDSVQGPTTEHRVYKGFLFIFSREGKLITMYPLPEDYYHKTYYDGKTVIRNAKRYYKMNGNAS